MFCKHDKQMCLTKDITCVTAKRIHESRDDVNAGCVCVRQVPKRICAAAFSADGEHAIFADKFGDVHVATTVPGSNDDSTAPVPEMAAQSMPEPPTRLNRGISVASGVSLSAFLSPNGLLQPTVYLASKICILQQTLSGCCIHAYCSSLCSEHT